MGCFFKKIHDNDDLRTDSDEPSRAVQDEDTHLVYFHGQEY